MDLFTFPVDGYFAQQSTNDKQLLQIGTFIFKQQTLPPMIMQNYPALAISSIVLPCKTLASRLAASDFNNRSQAKMQKMRKIFAINASINKASMQSLKAHHCCLAAVPL